LIEKYYTKTLAKSIANRLHKNKLHAIMTTLIIPPFTSN
jgi:hypothetical protein